MSIEFFIPELPKLPNQLLGAKWFIRASHAKKWKKRVGYALMGVRRPKPPFKKARIQFTRCSIRQCDFDGLVGSMKVILDALVHYEILEDDSPNHVELEYIWVKAPRLAQGVRIVIEPQSSSNASLAVLPTSRSTSESPSTFGK